MIIDPNLKDDLRKYLKQKLKAESEIVRIVSPYKLSTQEIQLLYGKFPNIKGKKTVFEIDRSLFAGVVIKHNSKVIDLSLKGRFKDLQKTLYELN